MELISSNWPGGSGSISKFYFARAADVGVVNKAAPRCTAQANSTCAAVFPTRPAIAEISGLLGARKNGAKIGAPGRSQISLGLTGGEAVSTLHEFSIVIKALRAAYRTPSAVGRILRGQSGRKFEGIDFPVRMPPGSLAVCPDQTRC